MRQTALIFTLLRKRALQNMSGGQQRRASLAVALLHEPELLILDEPTVSFVLGFD